MIIINYCNYVKWLTNGSRYGVVLHDHYKGPLSLLPCRREPMNKFRCKSILHSTGLRLGSERRKKYSEIGVKNDGESGHTEDSIN